MSNEWDKLTGYWLGDEEDRGELLASAEEMPDLSGLYSEPEEIDPRKLFPKHRWVEQQAAQGACGGHANTNVVEYCCGIATGEDPVHLSRQAAYIAAQQVSGIRGDRGSTISGNVQVAKRGLPPETIWPYPGRYVPTPPVSWEKIWEAGKPFQIAKSVVLRSYSDVYRWLSSGTGAVIIGIRWGVPNAAVIESFSDRGGGHAVALMGYTKRVDRQGRKYLLLLNSWGSRWGSGGWAEVAPSVIDQMFRSSYTVMIGMTDMVNITPRDFDFTKGKLAEFVKESKEKFS